MFVITPWSEAIPVPILQLIDFPIRLSREFHYGVPKPERLTGTEAAFTGCIPPLLAVFDHWQSAGCLGHAPLFRFVDFDIVDLERAASRHVEL